VLCCIVLHCTVHLKISDLCSFFRHFQHTILLPSLKVNIMVLFTRLRFYVLVSLLSATAPMGLALDDCDTYQKSWCGYFTMLAGKTCSAKICERYATTSGEVIDCTDMTSYTCDMFLQNNGTSCNLKASRDSDVLCNGHVVPSTSVVSGEHLQFYKVV
jgi:hypothetical protein